MGEMLEQKPLLQKRPEHPLTIVAVARPQDMVLRAHHIAHRVDLKEPQITDDLHDAGRIQGARRWLHQPVGRQPKSPQIAVANCDAVGRDASGCLCGHSSPMAQSANSPQYRQGLYHTKNFLDPHRR